MMKLYAVIAAALIGVCVADIVYEACVGPNGTKYNDGDIWTTSDPCARYMCHVDPLTQEFVEVTKCPKINVTSPCGLMSYPYKQYPDCCPFMQCNPVGSYVWNAHGHGK
ncbi:U-scoloptoxin(16)-Er13a-like [Haliotis rubra]|uniref:U-scoloptoxin(16)-Er13a-like n=1 Tax=Haliotis rubra TaxID=36100 RepID=UPI001EE5E2D9|nr:U-scoloptoxin(16)-Er13a-like [Haliotis rubra]